METVEVRVTPAASAEHLAIVIEAAVLRFGLSVRLRGTQHRYPGSQHWHLQKPGERGTQEVTLWPAEHRLWLSVQAGRRAGWITDLLP
jgi:hypothetical protein